VISDLGIDKIDTYSFIEKFTRLPSYKNIPIFMVTTIQDPKLQQELLSWGVQAVLTKPIEAHQLKTVIASHLQPQSVETFSA
jgi:response regulator RpfG family c-di-GMP phosphodiesterase